MVLSILPFKPFLMLGFATGLVDKAETSRVRGASLKMGDYSSNAFEHNVSRLLICQFLLDHIQSSFHLDTKRISLSKLR